MKTCPVCWGLYEGSDNKCKTCKPAKVLTRETRRDFLGQPLQARERQIAELIAIGLGNKQIASKLNLSEGTVKTYMHVIFAKAGVTSRLQLALWYNMSQTERIELHDGWERRFVAEFVHEKGCGDCNPPSGACVHVDAEFILRFIRGLMAARPVVANAQTSAQPLDCVGGDKGKISLTS